MAVQTKLQVRRDTAANWTTANSTLASGEVGFETDTLKFKIGNGSTAWASLAYQGSTFNGGTITNALVVSNTSGVNTSGTYTSTIATGTAPFTVSSTTQVANLNVATSGSVNATVTGTNSANLVYGTMADNDQFRILVGGTATNAGYVELATADDGTEPIYVRQYTGVFTTLARTATILDGSGNTTFPGTVSGTRLISNVAVGTAPFTVTSTTQVANLNVAISGSTSNVLGGATGGVVYQSAANTTTFLTAPTTNNSALIYNTATSAPTWQTPTQAMASLMGYTSTVTAIGYTSLSNTSTYYQQFTGSSTQTVVLPNTATLALGWTFHIVNNGTANVTANTFSNTVTLLTIPANTTAMVTCIDITANTAAGWEAGITDFSTYTGTGSVVMNANPTLSTPVLGVATGTSINVTGQLISTNAGAPLAVSNATVVANLASTYAIRGAIVGNTAPTVANTSNMARIYVSNTTPADTLVAGDIWISF